MLRFLKSLKNRSLNLWNIIIWSIHPIQSRSATQNCWSQHIFDLLRSYSAGHKAGARYLLIKLIFIALLIFFWFLHVFYIFLRYFTILLHDCIISKYFRLLCIIGCIRVSLGWWQVTVICHTSICFNTLILIIRSTPQSLPSLEFLKHMKYG